MDKTILKGDLFAAGSWLLPVQELRQFFLFLGGHKSMRDTEAQEPTGKHLKINTPPDPITALEGSYAWVVNRQHQKWKEKMSPQ